MEEPLDFASLKRTIRRAVERIDPSARRVKLVIFDADGQRTASDIVCGVGSRVADTPLTEAEREIMQVFDEADADEILSVADVAKRVGCDNGSHLRERLGRLVRLRYLVNERPGYRRT